MNPYRENFYKEPPVKKTPWMTTFTRLRLMIHVGMSVILHPVMSMMWDVDIGHEWHLQPLMHHWLALGVVGANVAIWAIVDLARMYP